MSSKILQKSEKNLSELGLRIVELKNAEGFNQTQLAKKLAISTSYLTEIKFDRAKKGGLKFWDSIRREYPDWENYLRGSVKILPEKSKSTPDGQNVAGPMPHGKKQEIAHCIEILEHTERFDRETFLNMKGYLEGMFAGLKLKKKENDNQIKDRRSGLDSRQLPYPNHVPERRSRLDRRIRFDRRVALRAKKA